MGKSEEKLLNKIPEKYTTMSLFYKNSTRFLFAGYLLMMAGIMQVTAGNITSSKKITGNKNNTYPTHLKMIKIVYFHDFPQSKKQNHSITDGCFSTLTLPASGLPLVSVLRCREYAYLLRPEATIKYWKTSQKRYGFIKFSLSETGINQVDAHIISVTSAPVDKLRLNHPEKNTQVVTGIFLRHSMNVKQYGFKKENINSISTVNVTGNHRFYVANKHRFIAIKKIGPTDRLITDAGESIRVVCHANARSHCGKSYSPGEAVRVYNLEINRKHTYFVSRATILAHNSCDTTEMILYHENNMPLYEGTVNKSTLKPEGHGIEYDTEGNVRYDAYWKNGMLHGFVTEYTPNNTKLYEGYYVRNQREGHGILYYLAPGKVQYDGEFKQGYRWGKGTSYYSNGKTQYKGYWEKNRYSGYGLIHSKEGEIQYEGGWLNNLPDGLGIQYTRKGAGLLQECFMWEKGYTLYEVWHSISIEKSLG